MAARNFSGDGKQETYEQLICWTGLTVAPGIHSQLIVISILNCFLSLTAFLGNVLILAALRKETSLHPPSKLLLRSLATTDLCVGLISQPLAVTYWMSSVNEDWNICRYVSAAVYNKYYFVWSVSFDNGRNKRGQTSSPVVGTEIQTSCYFEENLCDRYYLLGRVRCVFNNVLLEFYYIDMVHHCSCILVSCNFNHLLHKDFPLPPPSSSSGTRPGATAKPNKSTEHSTIQKGSFHCNMFAIDAGRLLSTPCYSGGFLRSQ